MNHGGVGGAGFVVEQGVERGGNAAEQSIDVREPVALRSQRLWFAARGGERLELADLEAQQLELRFAVGARVSPAL